jgi:hypothetical protein
MTPDFLVSTGALLIIGGCILACWWSAMHNRAGQVLSELGRRAEALYNEAHKLDNDNELEAARIIREVEQGQRALRQNGFRMRFSYIVIITALIFLALGIAGLVAGVSIDIFG